MLIPINKIRRTFKVSEAKPLSDEWWFNDGNLTY